MFEFVQICQHIDVTWLDSHRCRCNDCGKQGHWYEDGFVLWSRASMEEHDEPLRQSA
jgi:hypothetical protein